MPLNLFYTMVQKSQKWPKTQIKGGSCLKDSQMEKALRLGEKWSKTTNAPAKNRTWYPQQTRLMLTHWATDCHFFLTFKFPFPSLFPATT